MDLTSLKRLAEAATPGPWEAYTNCPGECCWLIRQPAQDDGDFTDEGVTWPECSQEDAAYIAALSPDKLLKLIAVVEAAIKQDAAHRNYWHETSVIPHGSAHEALMARQEAGAALREAQAALRSALKELDK